MGISGSLKQPRGLASAIALAAKLKASLSRTSAKEEVKLLEISDEIFLPPEAKTN